MSDKETVTISKAKYDRLIDSERMLRALEDGGVDNWEWYHESLKQAGYYDDEEDDLDD